MYNSTQFPRASRTRVTKSLVKPSGMEVLITSLWCWYQLQSSREFCHLPPNPLRRRICISPMRVTFIKINWQLAACHDSTKLSNLRGMCRASKKSEVHFALYVTYGDFPWISSRTTCNYDQNKLANWWKVKRLLGCTFWTDEKLYFQLGNLHFTSVSYM